MRFRSYTTSALLPLVAATIISCTGVDNPQLAMCQALVKELTGAGVSQWDSVKEPETDRLRTVSIRYTTDAGNKGSARCDYPRQENGTTDTAPSVVILNGEKVPTRTLLVSGGKVSKKMLTQAAELTALKAENMARDAAEQAGDLASDAIDTAKDAAKSLQQ